MIPIFWPINIALGIINTIISLWIVLIVLRNRKLIRSKITNYMFLFATFIFLANIIATSIYLHFSFYYGPEIAIPLIPLNIVIFLSILFLAWVIKE
jgi:hypothetical protein